MASSLVATGVQFPDNSVQTTAAVATPSVIPAGTVMLFVQTAAPTGFTKSTTHNNKALRIVNDTAGTGGSAAFTTAFGTPTVSGSVSLSGTVGNHTLTTAQIPSHTHAAGSTNSTNNGLGYSPSRSPNNSGNATSATGGGSAHNHSWSGSGSLSSATATINVAYVDVIIATKN